MHTVHNRVSSCRDWDKGREVSGSTDQFLPYHISSHRHQQGCRGQTGECNQTIFPWGIYSGVEQPHVQLDISIFARVAAYGHLAISFGCGRWVERRKLHPSPGQPIIVRYALMDKSFPLSSDNVCPRSVIPRASTPPQHYKKKKKNQDIYWNQNPSLCWHREFWNHRQQEKMVDAWRWHLSQNVCQPQQPKQLPREKVGCLCMAPLLQHKWVSYEQSSANSSLRCWGTLPHGPVMLSHTTNNC